MFNFIYVDPPGIPHIEGYTEGENLEKGQQVALRCVSKVGNPPTQLTWFRNDELILNEYRYAYVIFIAIAPNNDFGVKTVFVWTFFPDCSTECRCLAYEGWKNARATRRIASFARMPFAPDGQVLRSRASVIFPHNTSSRPLCCVVPDERVDRVLFKHTSARNVNESVNRTRCPNTAAARIQWAPYLPFYLPTYVSLLTTGVVLCFTRRCSVCGFSWIMIITCVNTNCFQDNGKSVGEHVQIHG